MYMLIIAPHKASCANRHTVQSYPLTLMHSAFAQDALWSTRSWKYDGM